MLGLYIMLNPVIKEPSIQHNNMTEHLELVGLGNITTVPSVIGIGDSFQIYATVSNDDPWPITFDDGCASPITASFDKNVVVQHGVTCFAISKMVLNPGQKIRVHGPSIGTIYNTTTQGKTNAAVTFSYQVQGITNSITMNTNIPIFPLSHFLHPVPTIDLVAQSNNDCNGILEEKMQEQGRSVNQQKAIDLAQSDFSLRMKILFGGYQFNSIFNTWSFDKDCNLTWKDVNVVFQSGDTNIVVSEDPQLTKVINVTEQYHTGHF